MILTAVVHPYNHNLNANTWSPWCASDHR